MALNPTGSTTTTPVLPINQTKTPIGGGNYNFGNTQNPTAPPSPTNTNPFNFYPTVPGPTGVVSTNPPGSSTGNIGTVTTTEGSSLTSPNPFGLSTDQANTMLKELRSNYGDGMGTAIFQYIMSGGGYNAPLAQQDVAATNAAMQQNINLGESNLETNLGASGIAPNSSSSALEISNYLSNAYTQMNQIDASIYYDMWNQSQNRELTALEHAGDVTATGLANSPSGLAQVSSFLGLGQSGASGASALISAFNPGADTSVLDALAGF